MGFNSLNCGKEASQILDLAGAIIAGWQGAGEDLNTAASQKSLKTNF
jgi:hypothetical protein